MLNPVLLSNFEQFAEVFAQPNPVVVMAVGLPGCGKSTIYKNLVDLIKEVEIEDEYVHISTDKWIERFSKDAGSTYNNIFEETIKKATSLMNSDLDNAIKNGQNVYWDQTNLALASRKKKLSRFPDSYTKVALYVPIPGDEIWKSRLAGRPDKTIPDNVLQSMIKSLQIPTLDEGFDLVHVWKE